MTWHPLWNPPCGFPGRVWHRNGRTRTRTPKSRLRSRARTFRMRGWLDRRSGNAFFIAAKLRAWRPRRRYEYSESRKP